MRSVAFTSVVRAAPPICEVEAALLPDVQRVIVRGLPRSPLTAPDRFRIRFSLRSEDAFLAYTLKMSIDELIGNVWFRRPKSD